jgi:hypothetical protein
MINSNDFNGNGIPLDDKRLSLSDTTDAGQQQYRIWRDSQQILVPRGQSITKPNSQENVQVNTGVFGVIRGGYFNPPIVEFRNTNNYSLFDRFNLSIMRDNLPNDGTEIDFFGLNVLELSAEIDLTYNNNVWLFPVNIRLYREEPNVYSSDTHFYSTINQPTHLQDFEYTIQLQGQFLINKQGTNSYLIGKFNNDNDELYLDIKQCSVINGSSEYYYNNVYNPYTPDIVFILTENIKMVRGWS